MCWPNFRCRILLLFEGMKALPFAICLTKRESLVRLELDIDISLASLVTHMQSQTVVSVWARCMTAWESWIAWHMLLRWNLCWVSPVPVEWQPTRSLQSSRAQRPVTAGDGELWKLLALLWYLNCELKRWRVTLTWGWAVGSTSRTNRHWILAIATAYSPNPGEKKGKFGFLQCVLSHILGIAIGQKHNPLLASFE